MSGGALETLWRGRRVVLCVGCGGSGKTTIAAAIAVAAARAGLRVVVMTIDPARRLADALGLDAIDDAPRPVHCGRWRFEAMMIDQQRGWDRLIARHAPTRAARARILSNPFYQQLSRGFAGSHEYIAIEQLGALIDAGHHDVIVVDTPPAAHALDFFDAPRRLLALFERRTMRWLLLPYGEASGRRGLARAARRLLARLESAVGGETLGQVADLFGAMAALLERLRERARLIDALLRRRETASVLVAHSDARGLRAAERFADELARRGVEPAALLLNRASPTLLHVLATGEDADASDPLLCLDERAAAQLLMRRGLEGDARLAGWLVDVYRAEHALARQSLVAARRAVAALPPGTRLLAAPEQAEEPCNLSRLRALADGVTLAVLGNSRRPTAEQRRASHA